MMKTDPLSKSGSTEKPGVSEKSGVLLDLHRQTVKSSTGMSSAVLLGSSFAMAMALFAWLGHQWDQRHDSEPWGVLAGVGVGLLYGVYEVWKVTRPSPGDVWEASEEPEGDRKGP